ncbi:MAG: c-type cytochrome [Parasphingorhabdus sp.]
MAGSAEEPAAFAVCKTCHSTQVGKNGVGPSLAGILGRKSGTVSGYSYSNALKSANIIWTEENLNSHVTNPSSVVPGNKMESLFPGGVPKPSDRRAIVDYLKTT